MSRALRLPSSLRAWAALALLPIAALAIGAASPERLLDQAYGPMSQLETRWTPETPPDLRPASLTGQPVRKAFAVGDRLTIDTRSGAPETIEITAIEQVDGASLGLDGVAFQMVTGRSEREPQGASLRFLFAVEAPEPEKPRTL
jgi:hypothetical protein